jgi:hypothetical protein
LATLREITDGIEGVLDTLYPLVTRKVRKHDPGPAGKPGSSLTAADLKPEGIFLLVTGAVDPVDRQASFESISDAYTIDIIFAKPYQPGPDAINESDTIRTMRLNMLQALNRPYIEGVGMSAVVLRFDNGQPYEEVVGGNTVSCSVQSMVVTTWVDREVAQP